MNLEQNIQLQVDENRQVNIILQTGAISESITVTAEAAQVETRTGTLKEVIDSRRTRGRSSWTTPRRTAINRPTRTTCGRRNP